MSGEGGVGVRSELLGSASGLRTEVGGATGGGGSTG
jgi:hypothetical protein